MPQLEEFTAGSGQLEIPDRGAEAFAQEGRRVGAFYHQMGADFKGDYDVFHQHQVDMDTSNTLTASSTAHVNALKQLQTLVADPKAADHPEMGQALIDQYTQAQNDIAAHASTEEGRRLGQRLAAERIEQFSDHVASQMSILAGGKAAQNYETYVNNDANTVADDPSQLPSILQDLAQHHDLARPHNLTAEGQVQYDDLLSKNQARVTMAAYLSAAHIGEQQIANGRPGTALDAAQKMLDAGVGMDVAGVDKAQIQDRLDLARTQGAERVKVNNAAAKAATEEQTNATIGRIRGALLPGPNGEPPDPRAASAALGELHALVSSPDPVVAATAGREAEAIGNLIKTQADDRLKGTFVQDDPSKIAEINQRRSIPPGQPGALTKVDLDDMRTNHQISEQTYVEQTRRFDDLSNNAPLREGEARLTSFFKSSVAPMIDHGAAQDFDPNAPISAASLMGGSSIDPQGRFAAGLALNQMIAEYQTLTTSGGMSPDQAYAKVTDPEALQLAMPTWTAYAKNGSAWAAQHPAIYGVVTGHKAPAAAPSAPPPRMPNESPAAYLKRTGG